MGMGNAKKDKRIDCMVLYVETPRQIHDLTTMLDGILEANGSESGYHPRILCSTADP